MGFGIQLSLPFRRTLLPHRRPPRRCTNNTRVVERTHPSRRFSADRSRGKIHLKSRSLRRRVPSPTRRRALDRCLGTRLHDPQPARRSDQSCGLHNRNYPAQTSRSSPARSRNPPPVNSRQRQRLRHHHPRHQRRRYQLERRRRAIAGLCRSRNRRVRRTDHLHPRRLSSRKAGTRNAPRPDSRKRRKRALARPPRRQPFLG